MDITKANEALQKLALPEWVKGRELLQDIDYDGDAYLLVWLDVDEDFEYDDYGDEVLNTTDRVKECIYAFGRDLWVNVRLRQPIPEE